MAATRLDLYAEQNATFRLTLNVTNPDNTPTDLTGCTARMQVRRAFNSVDTIVELNTTNGGLVLGGTAGTITLYLAASATASIPVSYDPTSIPPVQKYVYDLDVAYPSGDVRRIIVGNFSVAAAVTK